VLRRRHQTKVTKPTRNATAALTPRTVLQRIPEVRVTLTATSTVYVNGTEHTPACGIEALSILDVFSEPTPTGTALRRLLALSNGSRSPERLLDTIRTLCEAGVLWDVEIHRPATRPESRPLDTVLDHAAMVRDRTRTSAFAEAVRKTVRPGDVVLDIGTGTGVLAVAAAQTGARHVYAIEAERIGSVARRVFEANGVADRVTLLEGWSTSVSLPERADVLVTETIGNEPLAEGIRGIVADARRRLLVPNARIAPSRLRLYALPVEIPAGLRAKRQISSETLAEWQSLYGIDLSPFGDAARESPSFLMIDTDHLLRCRALGPPVSIADIRMATCEEESIEARRRFEVTADGRLEGVLLCFEVALCRGIRLSTLPEFVGADNAWTVPLWIFGEPASVRAGDRFTLSYQRGPAGSSVRCEPRVKRHP
jgi:hypothetical protein